tara:strand:- start:279 stop:731 length:453 start_codon:yes stop_codon:yes gene_type:complete
MKVEARNLQERRRATLVGAGAVLLWGSLTLLTTLTGDVPPFQMVAIAFAVPFLLALAKWIAPGESVVAPFRQSPKTWTICVGGLFGYHALVFSALKTAPPLEANLINDMWPLLIGFGSGRLTVAASVAALLMVGGAILAAGDMITKAPVD